MAVLIVNTDEVVVAGTDILIPCTLFKDGVVYDISGGTITGTVKALGEPAAASTALTDHSMTITVGASGTCLMTVTAAESAAFKVPDLDDELATIMHLLEVTSVVSGVTLKHGPGSFLVRGAYS